jgi:hypothetical protein
MPKKEPNRDTITLKSKAFKKDVTSKPGTNSAAMITSIALITRVKSPRVKKVIGKVRKTRIGLTKVLSVPRTTATIAAVINVSTSTPGSMYAAENTASVFKSKFSKRRIFL